MSRTRHTRTKSRCIDCGVRSGGLFVRCSSCVDNLSAEIDGNRLGLATGVLLGDLGTAPCVGTHSHRVWTLALRSARFGAAS